MNINKVGKSAIVAACSLAFVSGASFAEGSKSGAMSKPATQSQTQTQSQMPATGEAINTAIEHVNKSIEVVAQMEQDPGMGQILQQAKGVFIVPDYGRAAVGLGARGGAGVLLVKNEGKWSDPAFYNVGAISAGAQAGVEAGAIAMVLNNDRAVENFKQDNNFSLTSNADLTIVDWSEKAQGTAGESDIVVWADTEGLFGGLAIGVSDINFDEDETAAYYGRQVAASEVISGTVSGPGYADPLKQALASAASGTTSSGSAGSPSSGATGGASGGESGSPQGTPPSGMPPPSPSSGTMNSPSSGAGGSTSDSK